MENAIYGDTIIFSDLHCGLSANKQSRLNICIQVIDELINFANENNIENVIFGGDWFHSRSMLDNNTINIAIKLVHRLAQNRHVFLIVGNHDAYFKNSTEINSLNIFKSEKNVKIIDKAEVVSINGKSCLLTPWLTDMSQYEKCQFDYMIGHFEISSKYLMQSYIDDNKSTVKANNMTLSKLDESISEKTANLIGSFVDVVKRDGVIFAGHIHKRREFTVRGKRFVFIGSPY